MRTIEDLGANTILELEGEEITDVETQELASSTTLTSLDLVYNRITDVGAKALATNTTLTSLNLRYNGIADGRILKEMVARRNIKPQQMSLYHRMLIYAKENLTFDETVPIEIREDLEMVKECQKCKELCIPVTFLVHENFHVSKLQVCHKCF